MVYPVHILLFRVLITFKDMCNFTWHCRTISIHSAAGLWTRSFLTLFLFIIQTQRTCRQQTFGLTSVNMIHVIRHLGLVKIAAWRQWLIGCMWKIQKKNSASLKNQKFPQGNKCFWPTSFKNIRERFGEINSTMLPDWCLRQFQYQLQSLGKVLQTGGFLI